MAKQKPKARSDDRSVSLDQAWKAWNELYAEAREPLCEYEKAISDVAVVCSVAGVDPATILNEILLRRYQAIKRIEFQESDSRHRGGWTKLSHG